MAGKRRANKELNHENWDKEESDDEKDDSGSFASATPDQIAARKKIVPKRRNINSTSNFQSGGSSLFAGFTGFGAMAATSSSTPAATSSMTFSMAAKVGIADKSSFASISSAPIDKHKQSRPDDENGKQRSTAIANDNQHRLSTTTTLTVEQFQSDLRSLNEGFVAWCQQHVVDNPYVDLTPVFHDYSKHLNGLDEKYAQCAATVVKPTAAPSFFNTEVSSAISTKTTKSFDTIPTFSFGPIKTIDNGGSTQQSLSTVSSSNTTLPPTFSFGTNLAVKPPLFDSISSGAPTFSFGATNSSSKTDGTIQSSSGKLTTTTTNAADDDDDDDDNKPYEPPKVDIVQLDEPDAFYSIKCKLFYSRDGTYHDKGIGLLYLKNSTGSDEKRTTQLLIRAATTTGQVLLNISLRTEMKPSRVGTNNVSLVCIPNPPVDRNRVDEPTTLLIRVKTASDADQLLAKVLENL